MTATRHAVHRITMACALLAMTTPAFAQEGAASRAAADLRVSVTVVRRCSITTESATPRVLCSRGVTPPQLAASSSATRVTIHF